MLAHFVLSSYSNGFCFQEHYDYDCDGMAECPMVPTEADEGLVCEVN